MARSMVAYLVVMRVELMAGLSARKKVGWKDCSMADSLAALWAQLMVVHWAELWAAEKDWKMAELMVGLKVAWKVLMLAAPMAVQ